MINTFKALADENRLRILNILRKKEICVCELETLLNMTQSNVSRHLSKLRSVGIISSSKDAQWVHYKIDEGFKRENSLLFEYLNEKFDSESPFCDDSVKYDRYKANNLTCKIIKQDLDKVLTIINTEVL